MEDFLSPFKNEIERARSSFEKHIFLWCIENYVPLRQFKRGEVHLTFYENYCEKPRSEINELFSFLDKTYEATVFSKLRHPSPMTHRESVIITGDSLVDSWRRHITDEQIQRAVEILSLFDLDKVYSQDSMPSADDTYK